MALFALMLLTSLSVAFLALGQSEPIIGNNQLRAAVARLLAEAGVERAVWALSDSALSPPAASAVAGTPYDGLSFLTLTSQTGGFTVKVTGVSTTEVRVEAEGWTPAVGRSTVSGYSASDFRTKSHRKVATTLIKYPDFGMNTNCALCVKGDLEVRGSAVIDSRADTSCGQKYGTTTSGSLCIGGGSCNGNSGNIYGALDGNSTSNQVSDYQSSVSTSTFDNFTLSSGQLDALRQFARDQGTYYGGNTTFNASNPIPGNKPIVFVDGNASMSGNPYATGSFTGWFIVIGSAQVNGNGVLNGLLYATDDISTSSGTNVINGLVISQNTTNASGIDTSAGGNMTINFNCNYSRGNNQIPKQWFPKPGSWTEPSG